MLCIEWAVVGGLMTSFNKSKMAYGDHIEFRKMQISPYTGWRYLHKIW